EEALDRLLVAEAPGRDDLHHRAPAELDLLGLVERAGIAFVQYAPNLVPREARPDIGIDRFAHDRPVPGRRPNGAARSPICVRDRAAERAARGPDQLDERHPFDEGARAAVDVGP